MFGGTDYSLFGYPLRAISGHKMSKMVNVKLYRPIFSKSRSSRVSQKFVPIVNFILHKAFNASLGKCKLFQVRNLSK